jgi:phage terminase large subunit
MPVRLLTTPSPTDMLPAAVLDKWRQHPAAMVRDLFGVEPEAWQEEALEAFPHSPRIAMKACKGPGKTAVLAWIGWNFMLTRLHPMIGCTSISGDNLKSNLWTELARWRSSSALLESAFEMTKTEIFSREHPKTWKLEARTWARDADAAQIGNVLSGLHAKYVLWLLDESGDYPDSILPTAEGIFSGDPIEAHIVQAGNPTRLSGPLYRACTSARKLWHVVEITGDPDDPRRSTRIPIEHAREQIEQYGRENPWVLVNIFGRFPPADFSALIGPDEAAAAASRRYTSSEIGSAPRVLGVDVARFGSDASVVAKRQGIQMFPFDKRRNVDTMQGASLVARTWGDWEADACFIDATGGFGAGWLDQLQLMGRSPVGVQFAGEAHNKARYANKRAEMAFDFVAWIKRGGAIPNSPELIAALTQTTYSFQRDRLLLEPKEGVKAKLGYSPDEFDAAIMTFAEPVASRKPMVDHTNPQSVREYDMWLRGRSRPVSHLAVDEAYDPLRYRYIGDDHGHGFAADYDPFRGMRAEVEQDY